MAWYRDKWLWILLAAIAALKLATGLHLYFLNPLGEQALLFPDSITYVYPAQTFLTYGQFWEAVSAAPMLLRTPGYPVFLALIHLLSNSSVWVVIAAQNLLSMGLILSVYLSARQLAGITAGRVAAFFNATSVLYFSFSFAVLSEMLCAFFLAWFVCFLLRFFDKPYHVFLWVGASCLAAAIYVRPAAYYLPWLLGLCLVILKPMHWKKIIIAFFIPLVMLLGAWHIRNARVGGYTGFSTMTAYNFYFWNEDFVARQKNITIPQAHTWLEENLPTGFTSLSGAEQSRIYRQLAKPWVQAGWKYKLIRVPKWAVKTLLGTNFVHTSRLLFGFPTDEQELSNRTLGQTRLLHTVYLQTWATKLLLALSFLQVTLLLIGAIVGFCVLGKQKAPQALFLGLYSLYFWGLGSIFFWAYARFRVPFEFVWCILAGVSVNMFLQTHRKRID